MKILKKWKAGSKDHEIQEVEGEIYVQLKNNNKKYRKHGLFLNSQWYHIASEIWLYDYIWSKNKIEMMDFALILAFLI